MPLKRNKGTSDCNYWLEGFSVKHVELSGGSHEPPDLSGLSLVVSLLVAHPVREGSCHLRVVTDCQHKSLADLFTKVKVLTLAVEIETGINISHDV